MKAVVDLIADFAGAGATGTLTGQLWDVAVEGRREKRKHTAAHKTWRRDQQLSAFTTFTEKMSDLVHALFGAADEQTLRQTRAAASASAGPVGLLASRAVTSTAHQYLDAVSLAVDVYPTASHDAKSNAATQITLFGGLWRDAANNELNGKKVSALSDADATALIRDALALPVNA